MFKRALTAGLLAVPVVLTGCEHLIQLAVPPPCSSLGPVDVEEHLSDDYRVTVLRFKRADPLAFDNPQAAALNDRGDVVGFGTEVVVTPSEIW